MTATAGAMFAVLARDWHVFRSYRLRVLSLVTAPVTSLVLFYFISKLVTVDSIGSSEGYFAFVVIGVVAMEVLTSTVVTTPALLRTELVAGTWEHLVLSALGPVRAVVAMMLWPLVLGLMVGILTILVAAVVFGMAVTFPGALLAIPVAAIASLSFAAFGIFSVAGVLVVKQALAGVGAVVTLMTLVSGAFFPVALLPDWLEWLSLAQPITPTLDLMRHLLVGAELERPVWQDLLRLLGFTLALFPLSLLALRWAVGFARRRGTIIEY